MIMISYYVKSAMLFGLACLIWLIPQVVNAHCDTMDGPVIATAKAALEKGDITPILKWVKKDDEKEIQALFQKTLIVRSKGKDAKELADRYFFETLVRVHRAGEGAPYTGLKHEPAEPIIQAADKALESGSVDHLVEHVTNSIAEGIRERFRITAEKKKHANENVEAGREFVAAYVEFTHYLERLQMNALSPAPHHEQSRSGNVPDHQKHSH